MGGQQGKERHVLSNNGTGTITRSSRAKYRAEKEARGANIFTEHNGEAFRYYNERLSCLTFTNYGYVAV